MRRLLMVVCVAALSLAGLGVATAGAQVDNSDNSTNDSFNDNSTDESVHDSFNCNAFGEWR